MDKLERILEEIQDLSMYTTDSMMNIRENMINEMNGLMDHHSERMVDLYQRLEELNK